MERDEREVIEMSARRIDRHALQARLTAPPGRRMLLAVLIAGALAVTAGVAAAAHRRMAGNTAAEAATERPDLGWIAYSTAPANGQRARPGGSPDMPYLSGSDIYVTRAGTEPKLVAGRGDGAIWNVCPAFSPDGSLLAFGTRSPKRRAIRIVGVGRDGTISRAPMYVPNDVLGRRKPVSTPLALKGRGDASCPRWSADGTRLAYLESERVVVRGLDGSFPRRRAGDPVRRDFRRKSNYEAVSPGGDRVARLDGGVPLIGSAIVVSRLDGSEPRGLGMGGYALAGWPDGHTLLVMRDVSGFHFTMLAVPVDAPSEAVVVAAGVRVNHPRSWPGHGDVSWRSP